MAVNTYYAAGVFLYIFLAFCYLVPMIDVPFHYFFQNARFYRAANRARRGHNHRNADTLAGDNHRDEDLRLAGVDARDFSRENVAGPSSGGGNVVPNQPSSSESRNSGSGILDGHPQFIDLNEPLSTDDNNAINNSTIDNDIGNGNGAPIDEENNVHRGHRRDASDYAIAKKIFDAYLFFFRVLTACLIFMIPFIPRMIWPTLKGIRHTNGA